MLVLPSKEKRDMFNKVNVWLRTEDDTDYTYLDKDAPKEIRIIYERYRTKYIKNGLWKPLEA